MIVQAAAAFEAAAVLFGMFTLVQKCELQQLHGYPPAKVL